MRKIDIKISIKDLFENFNEDSATGQVKAFNNKLDVRPAYQREFIYKLDKQKAVIETIIDEMPLSNLSFVKINDDKYEVLDGQQRILSICYFLLESGFAIIYDNSTLTFSNLPEDIKQKILNYSLNVFVYEGTTSEKLKWFKKINVAGEILTDQEIRNALHTGEWLTSAKKFFSCSSRKTCITYEDNKQYIKNIEPSRQAFLELALNWISERQGCSIDEYMNNHRHDENAEELHNYFLQVISWVETTFPNYRELMKGVEWNRLFIRYNNVSLNPSALEEKIKTILSNNDIDDFKNIYEYVLTNDARLLNLRDFEKNLKISKFEKQNHKCLVCGEEHDFKDMRAHHIKSWNNGGTTKEENLALICKWCHTNYHNHDETVVTKFNEIYNGD